jgi:hypothetical protein
LVSLLLAALPLPVLSQGATVLAVEPAQTSVAVNGEREIQLFVTGADNLNAFDVQVEYDSALLSLVRWEFGNLLSNLAVVKRDDLPGSFRLVATQLATPGMSGDGVLLKLTFGGKLTGTSAITITKAEFARSEGGLSLPELKHGSMTVIPAQPTATPTRTPTATATLAPSATPTATRTATVTPPATTAATQAPTLTPAPTRTAEGAGATPAPTGSGFSETEGVSGTDEPVPDQTQTEPTRAEIEGNQMIAGSTGQGGASGTSGGNGYLLQKIRGSGSTATDVILFIAGLLAIGAAAVFYATRKKRV